MAAVWTPDPVTPVVRDIGNDLAFTPSVIDDDPVPRTLTNITLQIGIEYANFLVVGDTASGIIGADLWDHFVSFIDRGFSDLNQTPVVILIDDVPDFKEVYKIDPDTRDPLSFTITATANWDDLSQDIETFTINVNNNLAFLGTWIQDYIQNRYEEI